MKRPRCHCSPTMHIEELNQFHVAYGELMRILDLLAGLAANDINISVERDRLRCSAPAGALTAEFREFPQRERIS